MKPGSVIVDMAAEQGGNCELTEPGQAVVKHGVTIVGYTDLVSRLARQSSTLYSTNLFRVAEELCKTKDGVINVNMDDDAIRGLTVIKEGSITWPPPPPKLPAVAPQAKLPRRRSPHPRGTATAPASRCQPSPWRRAVASTLTNCGSVAYRANRHAIPARTCSTLASMPLQVTRATVRP